MKYIRGVNEYRDEEEFPLLIQQTTPSAFSQSVLSILLDGGP